MSDQSNASDEPGEARSDRGGPSSISDEPTLVDGTPEIARGHELIEPKSDADGRVDSPEVEAKTDLETSDTSLPESEPAAATTEASDDAATVQAPAVDLPVDETTSDETTSDEASPSPPGVRPITVALFGRTDVGQVREHNEDNFVVADLSRASRGLTDDERTQTVGPRGTLLGVCDGMGGAAAGEVASQLAVDTIYEHMVADGVPVDRNALAARLVGAIETAGTRIFQEARADRSRRGMGTTSTIATLVDDHLFLGQVGDSRGYILRGPRFVQVTRDQSLVNQLIEAGQLTEEEAETFEHNNIILQALGTADSVQVDLTYVELRRGDTLLLCSDGLSGMVRNDEIREVLLAHPDPVEACRELTDRANQAGGHDNVTVVIARFDGEGLRDATDEEVQALKYRKYELPEPATRSERDTRANLARMSPPRGILMSLRPSRAGRASAPDIEVGYADLDPALLDGEAGRAVDPVRLPQETAPSWIVTMMIVSAVTSIVVAGYYLFRGP
jgi:serine/threonine protein phosphatase PrpC